MNPLVPLHLQLPLLAVINPASKTANTYTTGWIDFSKYHRLMATILLGTISTNGTFDGKLEQANTSGGGGAKDVTGTTITQLTQAGTDSDKQVIIEVRPGQLDVANSFRWVRLSITTATAATIAAATVHGLAKFDPSTQVATVDEVVYG